MRINLDIFLVKVCSVLAKGIICCLLFITTVVNAHEVRPSYLSLQEIDNNQFSVLWKRPIKEGAVPDITPVFSEKCQLTFQPLIEIISSAKIQHGLLICDENGLAQGRITIEGLSITLIDVLVRIQSKNGDIIQAVIKRDKPYLIVVGTKGAPIADYIILGFEHIISGVDHLLFVLALILIVPGMKTLLKTITAFTLAHSITLVLATLGMVNVSPRPVEACIALSIVLMAAHALYLRRGKQTLLSGKPWLMAFLFGLLHGFGFAGALSDVGLPENDIPFALLLFNIGIELGQIAFILLVLALIWVAKKVTQKHIQPWFTLTAYSIGSMGMYFFISNIL